MTKTTFERIAKIIGEVLSISSDSAFPTDSLVDDLGADSLDVLEIVQSCEEEFGISIDDEAAENWKTVSDYVAGVEALVAGKAGG